MREMSVLVGKDLRLANRPLFAIFLAAVLWLIIPTVASQIAEFISDLPATIE